MNVSKHELSLGRGMGDVPLSEAEEYFYSIISKNGNNDSCEDITESKEEFLVACMQENLEHARHVENERLTFMSIFMAVVAGALALIFSLPNFLRIVLTMMLIVVAIISMVLTKRWKIAFQDLMEVARLCYNILFTCMFEVSNDDYQSVKDLGEKQGKPDPYIGHFKHYLYCFDFKTTCKLVDAKTLDKPVFRLLIRKNSWLYKKLNDRIRTDNVIRLFNYMILWLLVVSLIYFILVLFFPAIEITQITL